MFLKTALFALSTKIETNKTEVAVSGFLISLL